MQEVTVIGAGFVGLTTAVCFAHQGFNVVCSEISSELVEQLAIGETNLHEPGLPELLAEVVARGNLTFMTSNVDAVTEAEVVFLCLPTPPQEDGRPDVGALRSVAKEIAPHLGEGSVVVIKSTVPLGWHKELAGILCDSKAVVASNPEFLSEGNAIQDFLEPERILIGSTNPLAREVVTNLYKGFDAPIVFSDGITAELAKYTANSILATRLSFVNEIANLCMALGANVDSVLEAIGLDTRIGSAFLNPGPGWGGSCLPKDTAALCRQARDLGTPLTVLESARSANDSQRARCTETVQEACGGSVAGHTIALWGLAFKAGTNDTRESPALAIAANLAQQGGRISAYDPAVGTEATAEIANLTVIDDPVAALDGASVLVVATEWPDFRMVSPSEARSRGISTVVDLRNCLDPVAWTQAGITYLGLGRQVLSVDDNESPTPFLTS